MFAIESSDPPCDTDFRPEPSADRAEPIHGARGDALLEELEVRPVRPGEALELLAMRGVVGSRTTAMPAARPSPRYAVVDEHHRGLVATARRGRERVVVGLANLEVDAAHSLGELHLFIAPDLRGRGIGRRLFIATLEDARALGLAVLRLRLHRGSVGLLGMVLRTQPHPMVSRDGDAIVVDVRLRD